MLKCIFYLSIFLLLSTNAFCEEEEKQQELVSYGITQANVKDYYPGLIILDSSSDYSVSNGGELYILKNAPNHSNWIADKLKSDKDYAMGAAKKFCSNRFNNIDTVYYGVSNFDFGVSNSESMTIVFSKFDLFCARSGN